MDQQDQVAAIDTGVAGASSAYVTLRALLTKVLSPSTRYLDDVLCVLEALTDSSTTAWTKLPALCCVALGGEPEAGHVVSQAWGLMLLAARILDDVEDGDKPNYVRTELTPAQRLNVATGLLAAAPLMIMELATYGISEAVQLELLRTLHRGTLQASEGQQQGLSCCAPSHDLASGWRSVEAKSGTPCAVGCRMGARVGDGTPAEAAALERWGWHLGIANQISDDIAGVWDPENGRDLRHGYLSLPVLYALEIATPSQACILQQRLACARGDSDTRLWVQTHLLESGALHYLVVELERHRQMALETLASVNVPHSVAQRLQEFLPQVPDLNSAEHDPAIRSHEEENR